MTITDADKRAFNISLLANVAAVFLLGLVAVIVQGRRKG